MLAAPEPTSVILTSLNPLTDDLQSIDEPCEANGRRPLLIVVPDRYFAAPAQFCEYVEAFRLSKIFEIDSPERGLQKLHSPDNFFRVLCVQAYGKRVHAAEVFKEDALPFHHRQAGFRPDVTQAQNARAIGNYGYGVPFICVLVNFFRVFENVFADFCNTRCVPDCEIVEVPNTAFRRAFQLSFIEWVQLHRILCRLVSLGQKFLLCHFG